MYQDTEKKLTADHAKDPKNISKSAADVASTNGNAANGDTTNLTDDATATARNGNGHIDNHNAAAAEIFDAAEAPPQQDPLVTPLSSPNKKPATVTTEYANRKMAAFVKVQNGQMSEADFDAEGDELLPHIDERRLSQIMPAFKPQTPKKESSEAAGVAAAASPAPAAVDPNHIGLFSAPASPAAGSATVQVNPNENINTALVFDSPAKSGAPQPLVENEKEKEDDAANGSGQPVDSSTQLSVLEPSEVISRLKEEVRLSSNRIEQLQKTLAYHKRENTELNEENTRLRENSEQNLTKLTTATQSLSETQDALRQAQAEKEAAEAALRKAIDISSATKKELEICKQTNRNLTANSEMHAEGIQALERENTTLRSKNQQLTSHLAMQRAPVIQDTDTQKARDKLAEENKQLKTEQAAKETQLADANRLILALQTEKQEKNAKKETDEARSISELTKDSTIEELRAEIAQLKARKPTETPEPSTIAALSSTIEEMRKQIEQLRANQRNSDAQKSALTTENFRLNKQLSLEKAENNSRLNVLMDQMQSLIKQNDSVTASFAELQRKMAALEPEETELTPPLPRRELPNPADIINQVKRITQESQANYAQMMDAKNKANLKLLGEASARPLLMSATATGIVVADTAAAAAGAAAPTTMRSTPPHRPITPLLTAAAPDLLSPTGPTSPAT